MPTLLIIDPQVGMTWPEPAVRNNHGAEAVIGRLNGVKRTAAEVHAMALANLHGEYATVIQSEQAADAP